MLHSSADLGTQGPPRIRVLLADDHELVRLGLQRLVSAEPDLLVVGTAEDGLRAVAIAARERPDVVVMDLSMPVLDGVSATREICRQSPGCRVLVLTSYRQRMIVGSAIAAGACGYLLKDVSSRELLDAIRRTHAGESLFSDGIQRPRSSPPEHRAWWRPSGGIPRIPPG